MVHVDIFNCNDNCIFIIRPIPKNLARDGIGR